MKRVTFAAVAPLVVVLLIWLLVISMGYAEWGRDMTLNEYCIQSFRNTWVVAIGFWLVGFAICSFCGPLD